MIQTFMIFPSTKHRRRYHGQILFIGP